MDFSTDTICRTCLSEENLQSIYNIAMFENNVILLSEMLMECTTVKISGDDSLPNKICDNCIEHLKQVYAFRKQCETVDSVLHLHIKEPKTEQEDSALRPQIYFCDVKNECIQSGNNETETASASDLEEKNVVLPEDASVEKSNSNGEILNDANDSMDSGSEDKGNVFADNIEIWDVNGEADVEELNKLSETGDTQIILVEQNQTNDNEDAQGNSWNRSERAKNECKLCGKYFEKQSVLLNHYMNHLQPLEANENVESDPLTCQICNRSFTKLAGLRHHALIHTGEKPHSCHICNKKFRLRTTLQSHYAVHSKEAQFVCEHCSKPYRTQKAVLAHIQQIHPHQESKEDNLIKDNFSYDEDHKLYMCNICGRGFTSETIVREHCIRHGTVKRCDKCDETFDTKSELIQHKHEQHGDKVYECSECGKCFLSNALLQKHSVVHSGEKLFSCELCGLKFGYRSNLIRHIKVHNGIRPYKCHFCFKTFTQGPALAEHIERLHTDNETPLNCEHCGKTYYSMGSLKSHYYTKHKRTSKNETEKSSDEHELLCNFCGRTFSNKGNLKQHRANVHADKKPYECNVCGNAYSSKAILDRHSNMHMGIKPYQCTVCSRTFSQYGNLKTHFLTHTGERPFKCEVCDRRFTQRQQLISHVRTHTGEKPYSCTICGRSFSLKLNLNVHFRIHTGETPYHCSVCGKGFKSSNNMKKHQKVHTNKR